MAYKLKIKKAAQKVLEKLQPGIRKIVDEKLERLKSEPTEVGGKMTGFSNRYKFRQGPVRVIYEIEEDELVVVVVKIGPRGDVYKAGGG